MQDRYVGDVGDYVKYALLRALGAERLGVNWYAVSGAGENNADGKHVSYLKYSSQRSLDPELFDHLTQLVASSQRNLAAVESAGFLGNARFFREQVPGPNLSWRQREGARKEWFRRSHEALAGSDLVFVDPDNGLEPKSFK